MDESSEVFIPVLDAGQIEVTTVQVVQNVDADRILGTLKWLVDRVNKLSEASVKNDTVDLREHLQGNSAALAEQCKKQETAEQQLLLLQDHIKALQKQGQESEAVSQGPREEENGKSGHGSPEEQATEAGSAPEGFLEDPLNGALSDVSAARLGTESVQPDVASQDFEGNYVQPPKPGIAGGVSPGLGTEGHPQCISIAVAADGFPVGGSKGNGLMILEEASKTGLNDAASSKDLDMLKAEVRDLRSQLERMQESTAGGGDLLGKAESGNPGLPEPEGPQPSRSPVPTPDFGIERETVYAPASVEESAMIRITQGELQQLRQEVAELRLLLVPVVEKPDQLSLNHSPKATLDSRPDETQTYFSRSASIGVGATDAILVQTTSDCHQLDEGAGCPQPQIASNIGIADSNVGCTNSNGGVADSIGNLEQRIALLERNCAEMPRELERDEGGLKAEIAHLHERLATLEKGCLSITTLPEGNTESAAICDSKTTRLSGGEDIHPLAALLETKANASELENLKEALTAFKTEILQCARRSTGDGPPLTRLRSFQRVGSNKDDGGVETFGFTGIGVGPSHLESQDLVNIRSQLLELERKSEVVAAAVAIMAGPWIATTRDDLQDMISDKTQDDGSLPHSWPTSQSLGPGLFSKHISKTMSKKMSRKADGMEDRPDQRLVAASDVVSLQKLLASGSLRRKMDYVEADVFAILMKRLSEMEAFVNTLKEQATLANSAKPALEKAVRRITGEVAALKRRITDDQTTGSHGDHSIMSRKPIMGYRCMGCDQPLQGLSEGPGSPLPTRALPVSISVDYARSNGIDPGQHQRPMTASQRTSPNATHGSSISLTGVQDWYGQTEKQAISRDEIGPRLPPGGWRSRPGTAAAASLHKGI
eukprot:jgi/Botrbrau1/8734/Bobra.0090s0010.2